MLSYFGGISTIEGAPSTAYWDDAFRRLELAGTQADFALIEKLVFNYLLLSKAAAERAGRRFSLSKGILRKKNTSSGTNPPGVSLNRLELKKQMRYFFRAKTFCVLQKNVLGKFLA